MEGGHIFGGGRIFERLSYPAGL